LTDGPDATAEPSEPSKQSTQSKSVENPMLLSETARHAKAKMK
jgi:hypothetical protein